MAALTTARPTNRRLTQNRRRNLFYWSLLTPALALGAALILYPMYLVGLTSLKDVKIVNLSRLQSAPFTLDNFAALFADSSVWDGLFKSFIYMLGATVPALGIGLATAILLNAKFPGRRLLRTLILIPWSVPSVIAAIAFLWILDASYGVLNYILTQLNIIETYIPWLARDDVAMFAVIMPTLWKTYPFFTLVLLAALQAVPEELLEAAAVDGATNWKRFLHVTWPVIRPQAALAFVLQAIWAFREFDLIYPMTRGGPASSTETLAIRVYNEAFNLLNMGFASSLGILTTLVGVAIVLIFFPTVRKTYF